MGSGAPDTSQTIICIAAIAVIREAALGGSQGEKDA
jgi:hypothetical protein